MIKMPTDTINVGLAGDWQYDTVNRNYDLSRRSKKRVILPISHSKEADSVTLNPDGSALVIVDMQNAFLHPRCRDHPLGLKTVQPIVKTITKCREMDIEVRHHLPSPAKWEAALAASNAAPDLDVLAMRD